MRRQREESEVCQRSPGVLQVVEMSEYQQWMAGFGQSTKHVVLNPEAVACSVPLPSPATLQVCSPPISGCHVSLDHGLVVLPSVTLSASQSALCIRLHYETSYAECDMSVPFKPGCQRKLHTPNCRAQRTPKQI